GGDSLADFSVALIAGVLVGTASTVFTAVPIAIALEHRNPTPPARGGRATKEVPYRSSPLEARGKRGRDTGAVV
ncbi:hypothetical protein, partial [Streptomyces xanthochromogenes]